MKKIELLKSNQNFKRKTRRANKNFLAHDIDRLK